MKEMGCKLIVGSVQDSIDQGRVQEETGVNASRNALQTTTLLDTIEKYGFDACMGALDAMKKKLEPKSDSSRIGMIFDSGT